MPRKADVVETEDTPIDVPPKDQLVKAPMILENSVTRLVLDLLISTWGFAWRHLLNSFLKRDRKRGEAIISLLY